MKQLIVYPQREPLAGTVSVPGDKSISHRAIMLAGLADGQSMIRGWLPAGDTLATLASMRTLGVEVKVDRKASHSWDLEVQGHGLSGLVKPEGDLDCQNAGTCMRLLSGIVAGQRFPVVLDGSTQLRRRPMSRITNPLRQMGADIWDDDGRAPLRFRPSQLVGIEYEMPVASAQVKSAILLASLYAQGRTAIYEPGPTRDHTERMLRAMGAEIEDDGPRKGFHGPQDQLTPLNINIPGDFSSAAFLIVAATAVPHSNVTISGAGNNDTRTGLVDILRMMGAQLDLSNQTSIGGEPIVDLQAKFEELESVQVAGDLVVRAIDEFPLWAVAATQAAGISVLSEASELRVKEVDRIALVATELQKMGADIAENPDGLSVVGPIQLQGAEVDSHGDHRLGMALAVAGLAASGPTVVQNAGCIDDSFPDFVETMQSLGAEMEWR
jgi:3-phosphoshikimate 1-carboxyvinyltransferase